MQPDQRKSYDKSRDLEEAEKKDIDKKGNLFENQGIREKEIKDSELIIDHVRTIELNRKNIFIQDFLKIDLQTKNPKVFDSSFIKLSNLLKILHTALLQLTISSLPHCPQVLIALLVLTEILYILSNLLPYLTIAKFLPVIELGRRLAISLCLLAFYLVSFFIMVTSPPKPTRPVSGTLQDLGILMITMGIFGSYIFLAWKGFKQIKKGWIKFRNKRKSKKENSQDPKKQKGESVGNGLTKIGMIIYKTKSKSTPASKKNQIISENQVTPKKLRLKEKSPQFDLSPEDQKIESEEEEEKIQIEDYANPNQRQSQNLSGYKNHPKMAMFFSGQPEVSYGSRRKPRPGNRKKKKPSILNRHKHRSNQQKIRRRRKRKRNEKVEKE